MRTLFLIAFFCVFFLTASACEFCGCSTGNYFIGPFPQFKNYFIGTRYSFRSFTTTLADNPGEYSKDFYQTVEVWGGANLGKRWQVLGFVPYNMNQQDADDGLKKSHGLGDVTVITNYKLFKVTSDSGWNHQLWIGGGVKLPTGRYEINPDDLLPSANSQPGTGSVDWVTNAMYTARHGKWVLNGNINYRLNQSADGFQFGNRLAASAFIYRSIPVLFATLNPSGGLLYESLAANRLDHIEVESTGGHSLLAAIGLDTNFEKFTVGFNVQLPVSHNYSDGQTATKLRGMMHVTMTF